MKKVICKYILESWISLMMFMNDSGKYTASREIAQNLLNSLGCMEPY